jgi:putative ABC transport system permease protein
VTAGSFAAVENGGIAVANDVAKSRGLDVGDPVTVQYGDGTSETRTVAARFDDSELLSQMVLPRAVLAAHTPELSDTVVLASVEPGASVSATKAAVTRALDEAGAPKVMNREEYIESVASQIDTILGVVYALLVLAIVIALMGIANTLSLSIHERTRELGLLRAVGQLRSQMRSTVRWESVIVAVFGTLIGVGLGLFLGWALVEVVGASTGLGSVAVPVTQLVVIGLLGALAGVVAAIRPARRAARMNVLTAVAAD